MLKLNNEAPLLLRVLLKEYNEAYDRLHRLMLKTHKAIEIDR